MTLPPRSHRVIEQNGPGTLTVRSSIVRWESSFIVTKVFGRVRTSLTVAKMGVNAGVYRSTSSHKIWVSSNIITLIALIPRFFHGLSGLIFLLFIKINISVHKWG